MQSLVDRVKSSGERTQPRGSPVLMVRALDVNFPILSEFRLKDFGMIALEGELKSTNRILEYVPGLSRCCRIECNPMLTASSTVLFAR